MYLKLNTLQSGQVAPYKDTVYKYILMTDMEIHTAHFFCVENIQRCNIRNIGSDFSGSCSFPFGLERYHKFTPVNEVTQEILDQLLDEGEDPETLRKFFKLIPGLKIYKYNVCSPYTG